MRDIMDSIKMARIICIAMTALILAPLCALGQDVQVAATVSSDTVGVEDQLELTISVSGRDAGDAENPRLPRFQGFKVAAGPSIGTQFQWINGRTSNKKTFSYILVPEREGQFTIDSAEVRVGGRTYKTGPIPIRVTSAPRAALPQRQTPPNPLDPFGGENPPRSRLEGDEVFIRAELDRDSVYQGQQATLFYRLYTGVNISGISLRESPPLSGFWVEDLETEKTPKPGRQVVNGREYLVYTIKKQALFATKTGRLSIPSSAFALSAETGGDIFSIFNRTETLYRKTQELFLDVKPLPEEGRPPDFSNAVGSFELAAEIDKNEASTGNAVALRIKLQGSGNLNMIADLKLPPLPDFTIYSSKHAANIRPLAKDQIGGDKTWEYVVVPKAPGRQTVPSISFSYFNADKNQYETASTPALAINVTGDAESSLSGAALSGANKQDVTRRGTDIHFIKLSSGEFEPKGSPFYRKFWLYLIVALPLLFNAGVFLYQKQASRLVENTGLARSRKAKRNAWNRLKAAEKEGKAAPRRFYDLAASALAGYLADKFNVTGIELTEDNIERALSKTSALRETIEETKACLRECDFGRFVSAAQSPEKMQNLSTRIRANVDALERTGESCGGRRGETGPVQ